MKIKTLDRNNYTRNSREIANSNFTESLNSIKKSVSKKVNKDTLHVSFLYILSILSITCWIISLKILPFGDAFQFLLGAAVLSVNLLVFKYTKI